MVSYLNNATRNELIGYLESWGYACYDYESTDDLRQAALDNHRCAEWEENRLREAACEFDR